MLRSIKRLFSNLSAKSKAIDQISRASSILEVAKILSEADDKILHHDILPLGAVLTEDQKSKNPFLSPLKSIQKAAQERINDLALIETNLISYHSRISDISSVLRDTVGSINNDLWTNSPALSYLASEAIDDAHQSIKVFHADMISWPDTIFTIAPELREFRIDKSDDDIRSDREWDMFDLMNIGSRTEIRDSFEVSYMKLEEALYAISEHAMNEMNKKYPDSINLAYGRIVKADNFSRPGLDL